VDAGYTTIVSTQVYYLLMNMQTK